MTNATELILGLVAAAPGIFAILTRRRALTTRVESVAKRTTVDEFNALFAEQREQMSDCRTECQVLRTELRTAEEKIDVLENQVATLQRDLSEERRLHIYFEELHRRASGGRR